MPEDNGCPPSPSDSLETDVEMRKGIAVEAFMHNYGTLCTLRHLEKLGRAVGLSFPLPCRRFSACEAGPSAATGQGAGFLWMESKKLLPWLLKGARQLHLCAGCQVAAAPMPEDDGCPPSPSDSLETDVEMMKARKLSLQDVLSRTSMGPAGWSVRYRNWITE